MAALMVWALVTVAVPLSSDGQKRVVKVLGLSVEGNTTTDANLVKATSGLTPGREIGGDDIQTAIRQLWSLNLFSDIQILLDKELPDGVYLTIKVKEFPRLEKIELDGNKKLKKKDLEPEMNFYPGQVISPNTIAKTQRKLKKLYEDKGYLLAKIEARTSASKDSGKVILRFDIDEGNKVKIKRINFVGNSAFDDGKLRKQMKKTKQSGFLRGGDFERKKYEEDLEHVLDFYREEGFRDAEIVRDSLYYGQTKEDLYIDVTVREGPRYHFGKISFEGNKVFSEADLWSRLGFKEGDVYNKKELDKAIQERLGALYYDNGYIYAAVVPREIPVASDRVDISFVVNEGEPVRVNKILITGNTKTKEKVIRRELKIFPGDVFSRDALMRSQREVWVLNYFSDVKADIQPVAKDKVDVKVHVEEKSTDTANLSAGYSERDKLIGSLGFSFNNLFGNGQQLSLDANFGRSYRSFDLSFTEPWLFDTPTLAGFSFYRTNRDPFYIGYRQRSIGGSLRIGRRLQWPDNYWRADWIYRIDRTELSDFQDEIIRQRLRVPGERWRQTSSSITQIFSRNSLNRPEFPTQGSDFSISTEIAGGPLGGSVDYHKHILRSDWHFPAFWNFVLYTSAQAGFISGFSKGSQIPPFEYFYMGGAGLSQSIPLRGYDDPLAGGTIGGEGGKTMLKYSTELRFPIVPNPTIFGLLFAEAGNTWLTFRETDPFNLRRSVGLGVRIFMPMIGIIGFDYAYGFDNLDPATGLRKGQWKPHFVFGRPF